MHHLVLDRWSRQASPLHARDARAKLAVLLVFLVAVTTTPASAQLAFAAYGAILLAAAIVSGLPVAGLCGRAALVLPFSATFALITWWSGDGMRALSLAEKSYLSGFAALLLVATTPFPQWMAALASWHCPKFLILVVQFLYRYLFVVVEQAHRMRLAADSRRGFGKRQGSRAEAAAGAIAVLFARSWQRADGVYRAMLARGFRGQFTSSRLARLKTSDAVFAALGSAACLAIRLGL